MDQETKVALIRAFLNKEDLEGTDLKLKNNCMALDQELATSRADLELLVNQQQQINKAANEKNMEVIQLSQQLEGLCNLIIDLSGEFDQE